MKMFKTFGVLGALALSNFAGAATATHSLHVNVPFAFVLAGEQFKAGDYQITEAINGVITVQGQGKAAMVLSTPAESSHKSDLSRLRFTNSDSREYLTGVVVEGEQGRAVPVHASEIRKVTLTSR